MTFKKNGIEPLLSRKPGVERISLRWIGAVAAALGFIPDPGEQERQERRQHEREHGRSKRPQQKREKRRNMKLVSKRVRRKHRRAA
jgi:hypothetical protein